jgi:hypothetical protein
VIRVDITGQRFGRLVALERLGAISGANASWRCRCDCGNEHTVALHMLRQGFTRSCGCLRRESAARNGQSENSRRAAAEKMRRRWGHQQAPARVSALDDLSAAWPATY